MGYLVANGVSSRRLSTIGYGESQPIADNRSKAGRTQNRRVELQKLDNKTCVRPRPGDIVDKRGCAVKRR